MNQILNLIAQLIKFIFYKLAIGVFLPNRGFFAPIFTKSPRNPNA